MNRSFHHSLHQPNVAATCNKFVKIQLIIILVSCLSISSISIAFEYEWQSNETPEGVESFTPVKPRRIEILGDVKQISTHNASSILEKRFNVLLDSDTKSSYAVALMHAFINSAIQDYKTTSYWRVVDKHLEDDISIEVQGEVKIVEISEFAFQYANPLLAKVDGVRGKIFSNRLHRAVILYISDKGNDMHYIQRLLSKRYGVNITGIDYEEITRNTTGEYRGRFEEFKPNELIYLISIFEEFPEGMHKIEGLKYLIRRKDGQVHPLYPQAPAVAWPDAGYIEFMEGAFKDTEISYIHRLIAHEKAHFLWHYTFDKQLRQDWIDVGEWKQDENENWYSEQDTQFVSAYAHGLNPNEDMAESISYYMINPDVLRTRAPKKYKFIQERIMHGTHYISVIRPDLTFQVYNLWPDYTYVNRIKSINITVEGEPKSDKIATVVLKLHKIESAQGSDSAQGAISIIEAPDGAKMYMPFRELDDDGYTLTSRIKFSKHMSHGYWSVGSISIRDKSGNTRHIAPQHFGWRLFIDNPLADYEYPVYVKNSAELIATRKQYKNGNSYILLEARCKCYDNYAIRSMIATVHNVTNNNQYSVWVAYGGSWDPETTFANAYAHISEHFPSGKYEISQLIIVDHIGRETRIYFDGKVPTYQIEDHNISNIDEVAPSVIIDTLMPDTTPPELDVNNIFIKAEPTNPEAPDGETDVEITVKIRDDISGPYQVVFYLRDPNGKIHQFIRSKKYKRTIINGVYGVRYAEGDVTQWDTMVFNLLLPEGSMPGIWGLASCTINDLAQNHKRYDFTEIVHFQVSDISLVDLNQDGEVNILDLVIVANAISGIR